MNSEPDFKFFNKLENYSKNKFEKLFKGVAI
jgi:hypothetical protein